MKSLRYLTGLLLVLTLSAGLLNAQNRQLTFEDIMRWEDISDEVISDDGRWLAYGVWPDRGDGEVRVRSVDGEASYTLERGADPALSADGNWVAAYREAPFKSEGNEEEDGPVRGMYLLNTESGNVQEIDSVASFSFSEDGRWLAVRRMLADSVKEAYSDNGHLGAPVDLMALGEDRRYRLPFVDGLAFDSTATRLAYAVVDTSGEGNGLFVRDLSDAGSPRTVAEGEDSYFANLTWDHDTGRLAFTAAVMDSAYRAGTADLMAWSAEGGDLDTLVVGEEVPEQWWLRSDNDLDWTHDGKRLFFGVMNRELVEADLPGEEKEEEQGKEVYDTEQILQEKGVDVWHWDDPLIKTHERETWNQRKNQLYRAVYHLERGEYVQLATEEVPDVEANHDPEVTLARSDMPYRKQMTWDGFYSDYYVVDLRTGEKTLITERLDGGVELSPDGNYALYFRDKHWHLYDVAGETTRNLTADMPVPFYNEDHDYPSPVPGYGVAGWIEGEERVLVYDKYDIWSFDTESGEATNLTGDGRERALTYRIERLDYDREYFSPGQRLLLEGYYDREKYEGLYSMRLGRTGTAPLLEEQLNYEVESKADDSDRILFTKESYDRYPNLWVSESMDFGNARRLTGLHTDLHERWNWGRAEIIQWTDVKGDTVRGAVIKPDDYDPEKRYPVMTYFYRFFSQRAYQFNSITNDDRPVLPQYASDGYVVFLPDVHFTVGYPGPSSAKSLVPGILKLIDMGIAHPDKLGLHGHSWSGYQTAYIVTDTDIFDAAIAGAPVSNMTSAYSGIRWGSGLARQFQYEQTQSRIGGSLWEYPERYIENSPVFFADRINTPLLMMFGDEDTAVPWYQGIELYLAMRRLGKDAIFLQYHGEPHHLRRYSNRLDYAIKMKEYFDHYLKGTPAPDWIKEGVPYRGGGN